jgi:hypothetical protein
MGFALNRARAQDSGYARLSEENPKLGSPRPIPPRLTRSRREAETAIQKSGLSAVGTVASLSE